MRHENALAILASIPWRGRRSLVASESARLLRYGLIRRVPGSPCYYEVTPAGRGLLATLREVRA